MNICHLYHQNKDDKILIDIFKSFDKAVSLDLAQVQKLETYSVYIIELNKIDEEISLKLKKLFATRSHPLIFFYISNEYNIALFQLALFLGVKGYITAASNVSVIVRKIQHSFKTNEDEYLQSILGKTVLQAKYFLLFKEQNLFFVSQKLLEDFQLKDLSEVKEKLLPEIELNRLLQNEILLEKAFKNAKGQNFYLRSIDINKNKEKVIFFDPFIGTKCVEKTQEPSQDKLAFVKNRVSFIELLKEKLSVDKTNTNFIVLTLNIENTEQLHKNFQELEIQDLIRDFLLQTNSLLDDALMFAQYDKDLYIALFEDNDFEAFKEKIHNYSVNMGSFLEDKTLKPLLGFFSFVIENKEINETLLLIEKIANTQITQEDIRKNQIEYSNTMREDMSAVDLIRSLLEASFINKTNIKLLNIYKGLCINTSARIIKQKDNSIYVQLDQLQGIVMKKEKETVLQSASFFKDIQASVKHVSLEKNIAILDNFRFLDSNANDRKNSRVTCATKSFVVLSYKNATLNGEILDISVSSMAIASKYAKLIDEIDKQKVTLTFVLQDANNINGFSKMHLDAQVVFAKCDKESNCKIVCEFLHDESAEALLMEYVYNRQKEIIIELKKIAKKKTLL